MRLRTISVLLSVALLAGAFLMVPAMSTAQTSGQSNWPDTALVMMSPDQEPNLTTPIPAGENPMGAAIFQMNNTSTQMCYQIWVAGVSNVTQAHIHLGTPGQEGPVVAWLFPVNKSLQAASSLNKTLMPGNFTGLLAKGNISASDLVGPMQNKSLSDLITAMKAGQTYVNVHTTQNPGGEVRGQLTNANIWTSSLVVPMSPLQEPNLTTRDSKWNISGIGKDNRSLSLDNLERRNLGAVPWGVAIVQPNGSMIHYGLWVFNIANTTQAHFHMGLMGTEGPVVAWLYPSSNATAPANISAALAGKLVNGKLVEGNVSSSNLVGPMKGQTINDLESMMANGSIYVNVHTTQNPGGEIRGQVDPTNMSCAQGASNAPSQSNMPSGSSMPSTQTPAPAPTPRYAM